MKRTRFLRLQVLFLILFSIAFGVKAVPYSVSGVVTDQNGNPIPGVNIYLAGTYDGTSSLPDGSFNFSTSEVGFQVLIASFIGFAEYSSEVDMDSCTDLKIELHENLNSIDAVTITAGSFAASDDKRAAVLKPLDVYTTAGSNGDVMGAMRTMPGTQAAADDGRLLVRGGDAYETKTYIDGLLAAKPYYSKTPDVATRGRFSPSLFSGVMFNSGGYSAEFGQALSSVLVLNSSGLAEDNITGISLMTIGVGASRVKAWKKHSLMLSGGYTNLGLYHKIFKSNVQWDKAVESVNFSTAYRYKPNSDALFKVYVTTDWGRLAYETSDGFSLENSNGNTYANCSFNDCLSDKTCYQMGVSATYDMDNVSLYDYQIFGKELSVESRFKMVHDVANGVLINWGIGDTYTNFNETINHPLFASDVDLNFNDHIVSVFFEPEIKLSKQLAIRPGVRFEYSTVLGKYNLSPRVALAYKTGEKSQLSAAYGRYYQNPESQYLKYNSNLNFEDATHYILNYQSGSIDQRLFRVETYLKKYDQLITYSGSSFYPQQISNGGFGSAMGFDLFWRDRKSFKNLEYWVTYSYVDSRRKYQNYSEEVTPYFISDHTASLVTKYWINAISTQVGATYTFSSGKPFHIAGSDQFMSGKTDSYGDLSLSLSHIFFIGDQYSVLYASLTNLLGKDSVMSYRPVDTGDAAGDYSMVPVKRDMKRFFFIGLFLSF